MARTSREYWRFYWPLGFMAVAIFSGRLMQNYVLLHYREGVRELAVFALAQAFFGLFSGTMAFAPHMANVLVRGPKSFRACLRFVAVMSVLFTVPVAMVAWTPLGSRVVPMIYRVGEDNVRLIRLYLRYFTPLIFIAGIGCYFEGLLVQAKRTGIVSGLRIGSLAMLIGVLLLGSGLGWTPVVTLSLSLLLPATAHMVVGGVLLAQYRVRHAREQDRALTQREIAAFFLPMVATTIMFTLTRPIIFAFLTAAAGSGRGDAGAVETMIAGVSLAFNLNMLFQSTVNQFRHLSVTYGTRDLAALRGFMVRVTAVVAGVMLIAVASPLSRLFLRYLQGAEGAALDMACQALWVLVPVPVVIAFRNYHHGLAMVRRQTGSMAAGAVSRNVMIVPLALALLALGWYNHIAAAAMLVTGFGAEAATVCLLTRARHPGCTTSKT